MKNKIYKIFDKKFIILILLIFSIVLAASILSLNNSPSDEQIQGDLIQQKLEGIVKTDDFVIIDERKYEDTFSALVDVAYTKKDVQYNEKYRVSYLMYEDWQLTNIEEYNKELWTKKPTAQPNIEKYTELCIDYLDERFDCCEYDKFDYNKEKSKIDLDKGEVIYAYDAERTTKIEKRNGTILFDISFDFDEGVWEIKDISYSDSYSITYDVKKTWTGTLKCKVQTNTIDTDDKSVSFTITGIEEDNGIANLMGVLVFGDKTYRLSGTMSLPKVDQSSELYSISMKDTNVTFNCDLDVDDGILHAVFNRNVADYDPFFNTKDLFEGDLTMKQ